MIDIVVAKLKTGSVKNVVPFGSKLPAPPYVVVKEEPTGLGYTRYRIIAHFLGPSKDTEAQIMPLRTYCRKELYDLLAFVELTGSRGRRFILSPLGPDGTLTTTNSDSTISQEAVFTMPEPAY